MHRVAHRILGHNVTQLLDLLGAQLDLEGSKILFQVLDPLGS